MDAFEAVSLQDAQQRADRKHFTVEEANRTLPFVRGVVSDVVRHYEELCALYETCRTAEGELAPEELQNARRRYALITDRLAEFNEDLDKVGCQLKDYRLGLVDFPAILDGREVLLCWRLGEERIEHWHEVDGGYANRRPVAADFV